ncbi:MAG: DUF2283 domain-containing protein [Methanobacteriota archaeon]|nr:MAG: DUF2283 domain-containing protein [Euryarchaeota archaeon]
MKVSYDPEADAAYLRLSNKKPHGAIEMREGVILHVTDKDEIVGIEILDVSKKLKIKELFKFEIEEYPIPPVR